MAATLGRYARGKATGGHIALDGKTLRGSRRLDAAPLHGLSAFATELGAVIGDLVGVPPEANEITAALTRRERAGFSSRARAAPGGRSGGRGDERHVCGRAVAASRTGVSSQFFGGLAQD